MAECSLSELLPEELWIIVAAYAFRDDPSAIANLRSVCKSLKILINNNQNYIVKHSIPRFSFIEHQIPNYYTQHPFLISLRGQLCDFVFRNYTFQMQFPELASSYIRFSKFGWFLLSRGDVNKTHFFFNPFTRQKFEIPNSNKRFMSMCFSSSPSSSDCHVFGWTAGLKSCGVIKRGEQEWNFYGELGSSLETNQHHPIFYKDRCYCMGDRYTVVFNLKNKSLEVLPKIPFWHCSVTDYYLVADEEEDNLLAIFVPSDKDKIEIMRYDHSDQIWREIETLKNKTLFLSRTASFIKQAPVECMKNRICFPKLRDNDYIVYSYGNGNYCSFLGDYRNKIPVDLKALPNCAWIETVTAPTSCREEFQW
ncbi:F-box protein At4g00893-like [Mercurialis annua]|uniref:F-box protein At4g00893-like n=1 Tax=Mercurialis annua TaxID=3986 RepID=UPI0024AFEA3F|nr:F-box protein At4g00893-like [Mercurialis annua]